MTFGVRLGACLLASRRPRQRWLGKDRQLLVQTSFSALHEPPQQSFIWSCISSVRKLLQSKAVAIENDLRGTSRNFGLKVGIAGKVRFRLRAQGCARAWPSWHVDVCAGPQFGDPYLVRVVPTAN